jgi:Uma2 family endonuclease
MEAGAETLLDTEKEYEIINGQPEEKEMGSARHGGVGSRLIVRLGGYVETHGLGQVYGPDTTFRVGGNDRLPDVSFLSAARIPAEGEPDTSWPIAPDLAVEIVSPNDLYEKVVSKIGEYLAAGVRQVWLISPEHHTVTIYTSLTQIAVLTETDELHGGDLVPGFSLRLSDLFRNPARPGAEQSDQPERAQ